MRLAKIFFCVADCGKCNRTLTITSNNPATKNTTIPGTYECYGTFYSKIAYKKLDDELFLYWRFPNI